MAQTVHVYPDPQGGWVVKRGGASRDSGSFRTREGAEKFAGELCRQMGAQLVIHREDGKEERKIVRGSH